MRGLVIGIATAAAIIAGVLGSAPARADGPDSDERAALLELALAGAPLISGTTDTALTGGAESNLPAFAAITASVASPPTGPAEAPASNSVPPPGLGPEVAPQLPDIPNPIDWFTNLDPSKWAGDILNAVLTTIGQALLEAIRGFVDWATGAGDSSLNFVTQTPAEGTSDSPTVHSLWDFSRALVNLALAVIE